MTAEGSSSFTPKGFEVFALVVVSAGIFGAVKGLASTAVGFLALYFSADAFGFVRKGFGFDSSVSGLASTFGFTLVEGLASAFGSTAGASVFGFTAVDGLGSAFGFKLVNGFASAFGSTAVDGSASAFGSNTVAGTA